MRIINKTRWATAHLRAFASRVGLQELEVSKRRLIVITFEHRRGPCGSYGSSGRAWRGGTRAIVRLPSPESMAKLSQERQQYSRLDLATCIAHEMAHLRGLCGERDMRSSVRYGRAKGRDRLYAWALYLRLEAKPARTKPKASPAEKAEAKALGIESRIKQWEAKKRRADNALRKYRMRLKYYNKRLAAMNKAKA